MGGALAGILTTGRAPAYAQVTTLHWLRLGDFVPASDTLLRQELLPQAEKALGLKIAFETINGNDLQARITSAIQSGTGAPFFLALSALEFGDGRDVRLARREPIMGHDKASPQNFSPRKLGTAMMGFAPEEICS
jgi:hypothetical protein